MATILLAVFKVKRPASVVSLISWSRFHTGNSLAGQQESPCCVRDLSPNVQNIWDWLHVGAIYTLLAYWHLKCLGQWPSADGHGDRVVWVKGLIFSRFWPVIPQCYAMYICLLKNNKKFCSVLDPFSGQICPMGACPTQEAGICVLGESMATFPWFQARRSSIIQLH